MDPNVRPETMERITTPELANAFIDKQVAAVREQVGDKKVLLALSGGVDSSVVAALLIKAIGKQLVCVHVNHGLMRKNESEGVITMFKDGLYFDIAKQAIDYAMEIKEAFQAKGVPLYIDSPTNQQFIIADDALMAKLGEKFIYEYIEGLDDGRHVLRFCTSWSTKREEVDALLETIQEL